MVHCNWCWNSGVLYKCVRHFPLTHPHISAQTHSTTAHAALSCAWGDSAHLAPGVVLSCDGAEVVSGACHEDAAAGSVRHASPLRPLSGEGLLQYPRGGAESGLFKQHSSIDMK